MRGDRGGQTLCLIERLSRLAGVQPPAHWPVRHHRRSGAHGAVPLLRDGARLRHPPHRGRRRRAGGCPWSISSSPIRRLPRTTPSWPPSPRWTRKPTMPRALADPGMGYIFEHTRGKKCLVFANSREECETVYHHPAPILRGQPRARPLPHPPRQPLHLLPGDRRGCDERRRPSSRPSVTTATLELGIDIGRLERAFQIDAPFTVSGSFLQRMGRTGRRDRAAGDVVRHAGGAPGAPGHAALHHPVDAPAGHRAGAALPRGALGRAAAHWTACPSACSITRPCVRWPPAARLSPGGAGPAGPDAELLPPRQPGRLPRPAPAPAGDRADSAARRPAG